MTQTLIHTAHSVATVLRDLLETHARIPDATMRVLAERRLFAPVGPAIRAAHVMAARQLLKELEQAAELPTVEATRARLCMEACRGIPSEWLIDRRFHVSLTGNSFDLAKVHS